MNRYQLALVLLAGFALVGVSISNAQEDALEDTTLFMTFVPNIQFANVYVSLEKGYFEEAGYNVTIEHGDEPVGVDLIAANERQYGVIGGEQVIAARANERPVVFVYEWFQEFPVGIVVTGDANVDAVTDLRGQRVGIPGRFGASYSGLLAMLAANGMTESDIQLEEIGFNAPEVICVGAINASVIYLNNEPLQIENRAEQGDCGDVENVTVFPIADSVDLISNGLVTNEQMIAEQPERVAAMVAAFDKGLRDAINNPAEAYLISTAYVENLPLSDDLRSALEAATEEQAAFLSDNPNADRETMAQRRDDLLASLSEQFSSDDLLQFRVLLNSIDLWDADQLGFTDPASWEATQATLVSMGYVETPIDLDAAYSNEFLPLPNGD